MDNVFHDMRQAVQQAKDTLRAADNAANDMAMLLRGRLHHVNAYTLRQLKRELSRFDSVKKEWKP